MRVYLVCAFFAWWLNVMVKCSSRVSVYLIMLIVAFVSSKNSMLKKSGWGGFFSIVARISHLPLSSYRTFGAAAGMLVSRAKGVDLQGRYLS